LATTHCVDRKHKDNQYNLGGAFSSNLKTPQIFALPKNQLATSLFDFIVNPILEFVIES